MHEDLIMKTREIFEVEGFNRMLFTVQKHLEYPLFLDVKKSRDILAKEYGMYTGMGKDILYMRSHSKAYRPKEDGVNGLLVRFQIFRELSGISMGEKVLPLIPESVVVRWMPRILDLANYLIPRHTPLNLLTTPDILAKFMLFWMLGSLTDKNPEGLVFDHIIITDIHEPLWGDPDASFSFLLASMELGDLFRIAAPFFQID